jgi:hypothetical protein
LSSTFESKKRTGKNVKTKDKALAAKRMLKKSVSLNIIGKGTFAPGTINQPKIIWDPQMNNPKINPHKIPKADNNNPSKKKT